MFASVLTATLPRRQVLLRSTNGGFSWQRLVRGLDVAGDITDICVSPLLATDQNVFVSTSDSGLYRSADAGDTWAGLDSLPVTEVSRLACATDDQSRLIVLVAGTDGGVFRSDDHGVSWSTVIGMQTQVTTIALSPDFAANGIAIVGTRLGTLLESADAGVSWTPGAVPGTAEPINVVAIAPGVTAQTRFIATTDAGLLRSSDAGQNYTSQNACLPSEPVVVLAVSPNFANDQTVYTATTDTGVFKSTDAGSCWTLQANGLTQSQDEFVGTRFQSLALSPDFGDDATVYVGMYDGVFRSDNGGASWLELDPQPPETLADFDLSPAFANDRTLIVTRYGGGIWRSTDAGVTWKAINKGLSMAYLWDVAFSPAYATDSNVFISRFGRVPKSVDGGLNWVEGAQIGRPADIAVSPDFANDQTLFAGSMSDGIHRSTNAGASWSQVFDPGVWVTSVAVSPAYASDSTVFASQRTGTVFRSTDGGNSWSPADNGLSNDIRGAQLLMSPDFTLDQTVYAGTMSGLYVSNDGGNLWNRVTIDADATSAPVERLAVSPAFASDALLLASLRGRGLYRSVDGGTNWSPVAVALLTSGSVFERIVFSPDFANDQTIYGASWNRLFRSTDQGDSWVEIHAGPVRHESDAGHSVLTTSGWTTLQPAFASMQSLSLSATAGSGMMFYFSGQNVRWIGMRHPGLGIAGVLIDGVFRGGVDLYSATPRAGQPVFQATGLGEGIHFLQIVVTGQKNSNASGNAVAVDVFEVGF